MAKIRGNKLIERIFRIDNFYLPIDGSLSSIRDRIHTGRRFRSPCLINKTIPAGFMFL